MSIKKPSIILNVLVIALTFMVLPANSFAALSYKKGWFFEPYCGFESGKQSLDLDLSANTLSLDQPSFYFNPFLGAKLNKYFAVELGFSKVSQKRKVLQTGSYPYYDYYVQEDGTFTNYNLNAIFSPTYL